jgi:hypothetical protein
MKRKLESEFSSSYMTSIGQKKIQQYSLHSIYDWSPLQVSWNKEKVRDVKDSLNYIYLINILCAFSSLKSQNQQCRKILDFLRKCIFVKTFLSLIGSS